jgi:hypothetical protein
VGVEVAVSFARNEELGAGVQTEDPVKLLL